MSPDPTVRVLLAVIAACLVVLVVRSFLTPPGAASGYAGGVPGGSTTLAGSPADDDRSPREPRYSLKIIRSPDEGVFLLRTDSATGRTWHKPMTRKERFWIAVKEPSDTPEPEDSSPGRYHVTQGRSIYGPVLFRTDTFTGEVTQKHMSVKDARWERIREPDERRSREPGETPTGEQEGGPTSSSTLATPPTYSSRSSGARS